MPDPIPQQLADTIQQFLAENPTATLSEDGKILFTLTDTKYTLATGHNRCTLHLWSQDRNLVRRITATELRNKTLKLTTQKFGQSRPSTLELSAEKERRTPTTRDATRTRYLRTLERALTRHFQAEHWQPNAFRTAMDLERSFGPAYARGLLTRGTQAWAVIAVNAGEPLTTIDAILTFGLLWLELTRSQTHNKTILGLHLILPTGTAALTLSRLPWLAGTFRLQTFAQATETLTDASPDPGNLATRLLHAPNPTHHRFADAQAQILALIPPGYQHLITPHLRSTTELAFQLHGLEFARIRLAAAAGSFNREQQITFGAGPSETPLTPESAPALRQLVTELCQRRTPAANTKDPLYRLQPEHWLASRITHDLTLLDPHLLKAPTYAQVPAFTPTAGGHRFDRGLIDLLALDDAGRLVILEFKADEDPNLVLQGLDYWIRVRHHHTLPPDPQTGLGEFQRHGYFPTHRLSAELPRLYLVAPALRIHPATEVILRYLKREVPWTLIALDERWRQQIKVVHRKRHTDPQNSPPSRF